MMGLSVQGQDTLSKIEKKGFGIPVKQIQPEYPGGDDSLQIFLRSQIVYPYNAKINHKQGRVYVGFLIDKNGKISNAKVLSGVSTDLDEEALRVVKLMPDWKPGTAGGSPVDVQYILPIDFIAPGLQDK
jgi:TonB family protein